MKGCEECEGNIYLIHSQIRNDLVTIFFINLLISCGSRVRYSTDSTIFSSIYPFIDKMQNALKIFVFWVILIRETRICSPFIDFFFISLAVRWVRRMLAIWLEQHYWCWHFGQKVCVSEFFQYLLEFLRPWIYSGCADYLPRAALEIGCCSFLGRLTGLFLKIIL